MPDKPVAQWTPATVAVLALLILFALALLFPWVHQSYPISGANRCRNNLSNLALAVLLLEHHQLQRYPGVSETHFTDDGVSVTRPILYELFPYLDRSDLYRHYSPDSSPQDIPADAPYLEILVCPSNAWTKGTRSAYVYNIGTPWDGRDFNPANGVFGKGTSGISSAYLNEHDGVTTTVLMSENLDAGTWRSYDPRQVGFHWDDYPPKSQAAYRINGGSRRSVYPPTDYRTARPSSHHPESVNVAFADRHVSVLNNDIDYLAYAQLMTSNDHAATNKSGKPPQHLPIRETPPPEESDY